MNPSRLIIAATFVGLSICVAARLTNFGWNTVFYSVVVLPALVLHFYFQYVGANMDWGRMMLAAIFSLISNFCLAASSIIIPDGDDTGLIVAVFSTIENPPEDFYDIGFVLFGAGMFFSLLTFLIGFRSSRNKNT